VRATSGSFARANEKINTYFSFVGISWRGNYNSATPGGKHLIKTKILNFQRKMEIY